MYVAPFGPDVSAAGAMAAGLPIVVSNVHRNFDVRRMTPPLPPITGPQRLTGDTAEGADASVSTIAPTDNLRLHKAPICLAISGN